MMPPALNPADSLKMTGRVRPLPAEKAKIQRLLKLVGFARVLLSFFSIWMAQTGIPKWSLKVLIPA
ncbi:MAG: hypothetical protein N3A02_01785, partial [Rectinema sp.]|nr:hypothetical protein [Rectinema sp.]